MMKGLLPEWWVVLGLAGAACADNGHDVGFVADASQTARGGQSASSGAGGSADKGGSTNDGGASTGGVSQGGSAGARGGSGANDTTGGKPGSGGKSTASGGSGGEVVDASHASGGVGGSTPERDAAADSGGPPLCGAAPCLSTTCAGLGCGAARCCKPDNVCVRGAGRCPGEPAAITLQCWSGTPTKAMATFDKTCAVDADCIVEDHWTGCCSATAIGLAASQKATFQTFEQQTCGGPPPCGCCCDTIDAEDGYPVITPSTGRAICWNGACMTVQQ